MTTPQRAKGSQFERDVAGYFVARGFKGVERRYGAGATLDKGDINGLQQFGVVVECKNVAKVTLSSIVNEATTEAKNAGLPFGVAVIKKRNSGVAESFVVMTLKDFIEFGMSDGFASVKRDLNCAF